MITAAALHALLEQEFPGDLIRVEDPLGDGVHFQCLVVSKRFCDLSRVRQHQLVYRALGDVMQGAVHALAMRTYTPQSWESERGD